MMLATDFFALLSIHLVVCAVVLRVATSATPAFAMSKAPQRTVPLLMILLLGLWLPWGDAGLPLLAYARGVVSDLSVTSVLFSVLWMGQRMDVMPALRQAEKQMAYAVLALTAAVLYPTALGWGDWDAYRLGWGAPSLVMGLSLLAVSCFWMGLRLLPLLIAAAVMAWSLGILESGNLWDYLIDPWIACVAIGVALRLGLSLFRRPVL